MEQALQKISVDLSLYTDRQYRRHSTRESSLKDAIMVAAGGYLDRLIKTSNTPEMISICGTERLHLFTKSMRIRKQESRLARSWSQHLAE